jgi:hypothetical protein
MNPILRNILSLIAGLVLGNIVNMFIVMIGPSLIPPPDGTDMTTVEGLKAALPLLKPKHYIMPLLAHGLGTLAGAFLTAKLAISHHKRFAIVIGIFFLVGGIAASMMIPAPTLFIVLDLAVAYLPMAYLGFLLARKK